MNSIVYLVGASSGIIKIIRTLCFCSQIILYLKIETIRTWATFVHGEHSYSSYERLTRYCTTAISMHVDVALLARQSLLQSRLFFLYMYTTGNIRTTIGRAHSYAYEYTVMSQSHECIPLRGHPIKRRPIRWQSEANPNNVPRHKSTLQHSKQLLI